MGASIIEKHFTLDRNGGGPDDSFSLEPIELAALCKDVKMAWDALGRIDYGRKSSEKENVKFRRSLYFVKNMKAGDEITDECIRSVRPGYGLPPKNLPDVLGQKVRVDIVIGTPVQMQYIE
jgi:N-acetylneuraminate synthase